MRANRTPNFATKRVNAAARFELTRDVIGRHTNMANVRIRLRLDTRCSNVFNLTLSLGRTSFSYLFFFEGPMHYYLKRPLAFYD